LLYHETHIALCHTRLANLLPLNNIGWMTFAEQLIVSFQGLQNFKTYMEAHEKDMEEKFIEASKLSTTSTMEFQNFVSNKYGSFG